ncbi:hypothetical protein E4U41_007455 [Claviceps citrina]|nr:hypothetical protein E4U41_007455 [Claviceps citrina]
MAQIPVEIFDIITSHLTRADIRNLRLVCRDFEAKASAQYFRNVVVPFRSELYTSLRRHGNNAADGANASLLSDGMRIFESFGPLILRFALSLEIDEGTLACPPVKLAQEAVPTFWGIYRWPHQNYCRYTDLDHLEQTADETHDMTAALRCLSKVHNLGLCCDAGLGCLAGPDKQARKGHRREPVFSTVDWRQQSRSSLGTTYEPDTTLANLDDTAMAHDQLAQPQPHPTVLSKGVLERMLAEAGYDTSEIEDAIQVLLDTEGVSLSQIRLGELSPSYTRAAEPWPAGVPLPRTPRELELETARHLVQTSATTFSLSPGSLTQAQKEMLLELEWAHRALIQSFVLALVNNAMSNCFDNVTTFTVAKIPSCHLRIFCRDDVWKAIPSLRNLSLGVIADWRQVMTAQPGCVVDFSTSPSASVGKVFQLLNNYVGKCQNVESIHFEWICGGEFGASSYQRNNFILPAPFYHRAELMTLATVVRQGTSKLLHLPYIKHLSLKNCWSPPHIFLQAIRQFALASLEKLELESVSLSGPPTVVVQAPLPLPNAPVVNHVHHAHHESVDGDASLDQYAHQSDGDDDFDVLVQQFVAAAPSWLPIANPPASEEVWQPGLFSWAGLIDHFSPGIKFRDLVAQSTGLRMDAGASAAERVAKYIPRAAGLREDEGKYHLKHLSFRSCGYVAIDAPFLRTTAILPHGGERLTVSGNSEVLPQMQACRDKLLARISPFMRDQEKAILEGFGMTFGWEAVYDQQVIDDAKYEGVLHPGHDRFNGTVEATDGNS